MNNLIANLINGMVIYRKVNKSLLIFKKKEKRNICYLKRFDESMTKRIISNDTKRMFFNDKIKK